MNVLFLTLVEFESLSERNIYTDLLREFVKNGHHVYIVSPIQKRDNVNTHLNIEESAHILRLQIGNIQKTNIIEKGLSTLTIEKLYIKGIEHYYSDVCFDLVLYSTPPITLVGAVEYVKKRDGAKTYLLLKDIFPQNAVDLNMMKTTGLSSTIYRYFRRKEKRLYSISDKIGCMSPANVDYVIKHNPEIDISKIEVCPNCIEIVDKKIDEATKIKVRRKYGIPIDKKVFVYGGNLGKPQGIPFLIKCLQRVSDITEAYFTIIGDGTEYSELEKYTNTSNQRNIKLFKRLPKEDYDTLVASCDVGIVFLDYRFTIPNFPSRILSYMQAHLPVLAVTDLASDLGTIVENAKFGWRCSSNNPLDVRKKIKEIVELNDATIGDRGFAYLIKNYSADKSYNIIIDSFKELNT